MPKIKRPRRLLPGQQMLTKYLKPVAYWQDASIMSISDPFILDAAMRFRQRFESKPYQDWIYIGTYGDRNRGYYCYYHDENFGEFAAYSPLHNGSMVGQVSVDDDYFLCGLNVDINFRHKGIGTQLIRVTNEAMRNTAGKSRFLVLTGTQLLHSHQHPEDRQLTEDGWNLIRYCYDKGILEYDQLIGVTPQASPSASPSRRGAHQTHFKFKF